MKISVAMCTYNGEKYVKEQVLSILNQTVLPDEIIIQDDNSKDSTVKILKEIKKSSKVPMKIIVNKPSLGVYKNFTTAYSKCTGEVIFSCDQDDIWKKDKVEVIMSLFDKYSNINLIGTDATFIDGDGKKFGTTLKTVLKFNSTEGQAMDLSELLKQPCITGATMAFRKDFFNKYMFDSKVSIHDEVLSRMAALTNSLLFTDTVTTEYRLHGNNVCGISEFNVFKNIKTMLLKPYYSEDLATMRYNKFNELLINSTDISKKNKLLLSECISFWKTRKDLKTLKFNEMMKITRYFKKKGYYERFNLNHYLKWIDRYTWLVYKIRPRKRK